MPVVSAEADRSPGLLSRFAFSTLAFPGTTLAAAASLGRRWGYTGVELRLIDGELIDPRMPATARARVKRHAATGAGSRSRGKSTGIPRSSAREALEIVCAAYESSHRPAGEDGLRATFDPANFVQRGVRPFSDAYGLLRPYLVYLQVKDARAVTGEVVPAGRGDGQLRETLGALRDSGFAGFMSLEPHLAQAGRYGGFSGPEGFRQASQALKLLLNEASISWQ